MPRETMELSKIVIGGMRLKDRRSGVATLRAAIEEANALGGAAGEAAAEPVYLTVRAGRQTVNMTGGRPSIGAAFAARYGVPDQLILPLALDSDARIVDAEAYFRELTPRRHRVLTRLEAEAEKEKGIGSN